MPWGAAAFVGASIYSANKQAGAASDAAAMSAQAQLEAARIAAEAQAFRPVGITSRFGTSNFTMDGNKLTGASYTASPEIQAYQNWLSSQAPDAAMASKRLLSLGQGYIGEDPEAIRQRYIAQQQALLAPENEKTLAGIRNNLFQTGRAGLATGATTAGDLAATNPEMAAYYNSIAKQNAALAAGAEQAAQQQVTYGQGLLSNAYAPLQTNIGLQAELEKLAMTPLQVGAELGGRSATAGANVGQSLLAGGMGAARTMQAANSYSPTAATITGLTSNPYLMYNLFNRPQQPATPASTPNPYANTWGYNTGGAGYGYEGDTSGLSYVY